MIITNLDEIVLTVIIGIVLFFGAVRLVGWMTEDRKHGGQ